MIYITFTVYISLALFIAFLIRKLFKNIFLKRMMYSFFLSLFISFWFLYPGSRELAPVFSIYLINLFESESIVQMRLIRPFLLVFILIVILDFFLFRYKSKKK